MVCQINGFWMMGIQIVQIISVGLQIEVLCGSGVISSFYKCFILKVGGGVIFVLFFFWSFRSRQVVFVIEKVQVKFECICCFFKYGFFKLQRKFFFKVDQLNNRMLLGMVQKGYSELVWVCFIIIRESFVYIIINDGFFSFFNIIDYSFVVQDFFQKGLWVGSWFCLVEF